MENIILTQIYRFSGDTWYHFTDFTVIVETQQ